ncbi:MAG: GHMP family kinase ATP-binding protein [Promethearchaeota archaeon]
MKNKIKVKIPGRICILGDKVDLLKKPVIAMAITLMMEIQYEENPDGMVEFYSHDTNEHVTFALNEKPPLAIDLAYWSVLFERLRPKINKGFRVEVKSDIPIGCGLSTSAAVSVGFLKVLNQGFNLNLTTKEIAELAYLGENHDLGIQCGRMDQYSIAFGGVTFIHTDENPRVEYLNVEELPIVVGDSLEERKAASVLNRIKKQILEKDPTTLNAFKVIERCVLEGKEALLKGDFKKLGKLMDLQQEQEIILNAHTDKILKLCSVAKDAGALGAKQMGAGGGGCMLALCPNNQKEVARAIEKAGGRAWIFNIFRY